MNASPSAADSASAAIMHIAPQAGAPSSERHHSTAAAPAARKSPAWRRKPEPSSSGSAAFSPIEGDVGWDWFAPVNAGVFSA